MERQTALNKLRKILGPKFGYRIDEKAPRQGERDQVRVDLKILSVEHDALVKLRDARRAEILAADPEYQRLEVECLESCTRRDAARSKLNHFRITVGVGTGLWFLVKAQGDTWEEVFSKVKKKEPL